MRSKPVLHFALLLSLMIATVTPISASAVGGNGACDVSNFSTGNGSSGSPYGIANADDLLELGDCTASANNWSSGKFFQLTNDVDLGGISWRPLGTTSTAFQFFKGSLDGQGFRILNLNANTSNSGGAHITSGRGLFWAIEGASIKNLEIQGVLSVAPFANHGVIAVRAAGGLISGVTTRVSIICENFTSSNRSIGGLVGEAISGGTLTISNTRILNSNTSPGVNCPDARGTNVDNNALFIGGLVGRAYNTSNVTATSVSVEIPIAARAHFVSIGGLIGGQTDADGTGGKITISNSEYSGAMTLGSGSEPAEVGGAVGYAEDKEVDIDRFVASGSISIAASKKYRVGGVVGVLENRDNTNKSHVKDTYAGMTINFEHSGTAGEGAVGGIVGEQIAGTVRATWSTGGISQNSGTQLTNQGAVIGKLTGSDSTDTNNYNFFDAESYPTLGPHGGTAAVERPTTRPYNYRKIYEDERSVLGTFRFDASLYLSIQSYPDAGGSSTWLICEEPFLRWQGVVESCLPRLTAASITASGEAITVTFSRAINHDGSNDLGLPPGSVFAISVSGGSASVQSVSRGTDSSNRTLLLILEKRVASTDTVSLSYNPPFPSSASPDVLEDNSSGEDVSPISNFPVTNNSTLGPRLEFLNGGRVLSYFVNTKVLFEVTECPGVSFNPSNVLEARVDGQVAQIQSQTFSTADCSTVPFRGFEVTVNQKIFRDQTLTLTYKGDSTGINGPNSLVASNGLTYTPGNFFTVSEKAFAVWRPIVSQSSLVSASSAIQIEFQTYGEGLAFSKTPGTTIFANPHPLFDHLTLTGATSSGAPTISGSVLTVPLGNTIYRGDSLSVSYVDPNPSTNDNLNGLLELADGPQTGHLEDAKPFSFVIDTSASPTQPELSSASVNSSGRALALVFNEDVSPTTPDPAAVIVTIDGTQATVSSLVRSVATNTLIVNLQTAVVMPGATVMVVYSDPTPGVEDPPSSSIGSATGDWDAKSFSQGANNSSSRTLPSADATVSFTQNSITAVASCQAGCPGAGPDGARFVLSQAGTEVASNTSGQFVGLIAGTEYVLQISIEYDGLTSPSISKTVTTSLQTQPPAPAPAPAPAANPTISPVATQSPSTTTSPQPSPEPSPLPTATPNPDPEVSPSPTPVPTVNPAGNPIPSPTPTPTPTSEPEPTAAPEEPADPAPVVASPLNSSPSEPDQTPTPEESPDILFVEEITNGVISLQDGQEVVIFSAALLEDVVFQLAPLGASINAGTLRVQTSVRSVELLVVDLGAISFTAFELGEYVEFTLLIPGFEENSLRVLVSRQDAEQLTWVIFAAAATTAGILLSAFWVIFKRRRRRNERVN